MDDIFEYFFDKSMASTHVVNVIDVMVSNVSKQHWSELKIKQKDLSEFTLACPDAEFTAIPTPTIEIMRLGYISPNFRTSEHWGYIIKQRCLMKNERFASPKNEDFTSGIIETSANPLSIDLMLDTRTSTFSDISFHRTTAPFFWEASCT
jgi:hypothetical protein